MKPLTLLLLSLPPAPAAASFSANCSASFTTPAIAAKGEGPLLPFVVDLGALGRRCGARRVLLDQGLFLGSLGLLVVSTLDDLVALRLLLRDHQLHALFGVTDKLICSHGFLLLIHSVESRQFFFHPLPNLIFLLFASVAPNGRRRAFRVFLFLRIFQ